MESKTITGNTSKSGRMANLELLRCVAMMMVVVLHFLGKGYLLPEIGGPYLGTTGWVAWLLEGFCIVAVNVYMLISGYFLSASSFKLSRLIGLWLQLWFYSVCFGLAGAIIGLPAETALDTHYFLTLLFPVSMGHYWFITAYIFLYILLPFVGRAVRQMSRQQLQAAIGLLLLVFCLMKSVLPVRLEMDKLGYDCLWYLCVFLTAAYIRRFGIPFLEKEGRGIVLYIVCCLLIFSGTMGLRAVYLRTGNLGLMLKWFYEYNHILPFFASVGLFMAFLKLRVKGGFGTFVTKIAPYTLGVYLLHENLGFRYRWQNWLGAARISSVPELLAGTAAAVVCVFACGILVDMVRNVLTRGLDRLLGGLGFYKVIKNKITKADELLRV